MCVRGRGGGCPEEGGFLSCPWRDGDSHPWAPAPNSTLTWNPEGFPLNQGFSHVTVCTSPPGTLLRCRLGFSRYGLGSKILHFQMFPGDAHAAGIGNRL